MNTTLCNMCMIEDVATGRILVQHRVAKPTNPWCGLTFPGVHMVDATFKVESQLPPVTTPVTTLPDSCLVRLIFVLEKAKSNLELLSLLGLKERKDLLKRFLNPAMKFGYIEFTIPGKPNSRLQKYRLTALGRQLRDELRKSGNA